MAEIDIILNPIDLAGDKACVSCFTLIDGFDGLSGTIGAIFVKELRDDGDRLVELPRLCRTFIMHGSLAFIASDNLRLAQ